MVAVNDALATLLLKQDVEAFLYHEANLLDDRRYEEWLELLADDVRYWVPMRRNVKFGELEREFTREGQDINWFDEGKDTLTRRVNQILTGVHWAEEPLSRISHLVTNVGNPGRQAHAWRRGGSVPALPLHHLPQPRRYRNRHSRRPAGGHAAARR